MKREQELEKGLYFVHGYYMSDNNEYALRDNNGYDIHKPNREQMILIKESIDSIYDIEAYDISLREMCIQNDMLPQGEFVYYNGKSFRRANDDPTSITYTELNRQLIGLIGNENYGNRPEEISDEISDEISGAYSYHVNVGHGNCSIIVLGGKGKYNIWMVDCSVFDFTNRQNYSSNLDRCMDDIHNKFGVGKISKLLITHLHYDHINGIEYLIQKGWIDGDTEVWMNTQYPWIQSTYNRILLQLRALGVRFIDPVVSNSTQHINILYPYISFNKKNNAPANNINNASVLYQICVNRNSMLFTGDIEMEGWDSVTGCPPYLNGITYYCVSHHGSITGHLRNVCKYRSISTLADCAGSTKLQILMGRDCAYKGIFSQNVISDFHTILRTDDPKHYIEIEWSSGRYEFQ